MEDRLLQSERLAAVGNTVTHIAHEIKNPLLIIGGFARQLLKATELDDKARQETGHHRRGSGAPGRDDGGDAGLCAPARPPEKPGADLDAVLNEVLEFFQDTFTGAPYSSAPVKEDALYRPSPSTPSRCARS